MVALRGNSIKQAIGIHNYDRLAEANHQRRAPGPKLQNPVNHEDDVWVSE